MKKLLVATGLMICLSAVSYAQSATQSSAGPAGVSLKMDPQQATPLPASRSNASLLRADAAKRQQAATESQAAAPNPQLVQPAGNTAPVPYQTTMNSTAPGATGSTPVTAKTQEFNLGGQKASSTIYYDNTGKMTGHQTTIKLGK